MEVEQTDGGGEKSEEAGGLCFDPMDGVHVEMLDPIWSELDGFGSGVLNELLSSEIHDGGALAEAAHGGMVPDATSLGGEVNVHDYLTMKDLPKSNTEAPYGLPLPGNGGNLGFQGGSFQVKEELLVAELDSGSVGLQNSNENAECGVRRREQFLLQSNAREVDVTHEELCLVGVDSINNGSEEMLGAANVGTEEIIANQEGGGDAKVCAVIEGKTVEHDWVDAAVLEINTVNWIKQEGLEESGAQVQGPLLGTGALALVKDEFPPQRAPEKPHSEISVEAASGKGELLSQELKKDSRGVDNANSSVVSGAPSQEQVLLRVEDGHKELNLGLIGVGSARNSSERIFNVHELQDTQLPIKENEKVPRGIQQELLGVAHAGPQEILLKQDERIGDKVDVLVDVKQEVCKVEDDARVSVLDNVNRRKQLNGGESDSQDSEVDDEDITSVDNEETSPEQALILAENRPSKRNEFISEMLRDGVLSAEGLASKGFVFISDDESDRHEDGDSSSEDEEEEESDDVTSMADSEEEVAPGNGKAKTARKEKEEMKDADEAGPPRTKHELDVLPTVPKVTAVLEPHHHTMSVGQISSVLDLRVIVESSGSERVLNENSIIWLTESRVPLGIVDEVFGPVKNPFYLVRFNELSEIPVDAKAGADVSYVSEFSEFVLKDNPSLYRKAVDASGLDDEELGSDEDLEFSDDEKEAAARMREKNKRGLEHRESRQGQDWKSADGQHAKGQRTERGRGRGRSGGRGSATANAVDSAADFVAGMDIKGSSRHATRPASNQQNGRRWNRGRQNSPRNSGHQEYTRGSRAGPLDGQRRSPQLQDTPRQRDAVTYAEQANRQMYVEQASRQIYAEQANRQMLAEQANRQVFAQQAGRHIVLSQQGNQAGGMPGTPFNPGAIPALLQGQGILRQQTTTGFQGFGYPQVGYDARQGNVHSVPGGHQFIQNSVGFSNPNPPPNPYFNNQGQGQMSMIHNPGHGHVIHAGQMSFGVPVNHSLGDAQAGVYSSLTSFTSPSSSRGNGAVARDHRNRSMSQNGQIQGPQRYGPNKYYK